MAKGREGRCDNVVTDYPTTIPTPSSSDRIPPQRERCPAVRDRSKAARRRMTPMAPLSTLSFQRIGVMATHSPTIRPACPEQTVRIGHSPLASSHFDGCLPWVDGRFPWVARQHTNIGRPRDRTLSRSGSAILPCGSVAKRKLTECRKDHARWAPRAAFLALSAAMMFRQLGSRP